MLFSLNIIFSIKIYFLGRYDNILRYKIISDELCEFNIARYFANNTTLSLITKKDIILYKICPEKIISPLTDIFDFRFNLNIKSDCYFAILKIKFEIKKQDLVEMDNNRNYKFKHQFRTYISSKKFDEYMKIQPEHLPNIYQPICCLNY